MFGGGGGLSCNRRYLCHRLQVFLVRKIVGTDTGKMYAMKVLKKASLKGR